MTSHWELEISQKKSIYTMVISRCYKSVFSLPESWLLSFYQPTTHSKQSYVLVIIVTDKETMASKEPAKGMEDPYMVPFTAAP